MPQGSKIQDAETKKFYVVGKYLGDGHLSVVYDLLNEDGVASTNAVVKEPKSHLSEDDRKRFELEVEILNRIQQAAEERQWPLPVPRVRKGLRDYDSRKPTVVVCLEKVEAEDWKLERLVNDDDLTRDNETQLQAAIHYTYLLELLHESDKVGYFCRDRTAQDLLWRPDQKRLIVLDWNVVEPIPTLGQIESASVDKRADLFQEREEAWADGQYRFGALWYQILVGESFGGGNPDEPISEEGRKRWAEQISEGMRGILRRCLDASPKQRYPTAQALRDALEHQTGLLKTSSRELMLEGVRAREAALKASPSDPELNRQALATYDMAARRDEPEAKKALDKMRAAIARRGRAHLENAYEYARLPNWEKAKEELTLAHAEANRQWPLLLEIYRWFFVVEAGAGANRDLSSRREAKPLIDGPRFASLARALEAMRDKKWTAAREHISGVIEELQWSSSASESLGDLTVELDIQDAIVAAQAALNKGDYENAAARFQEADAWLASKLSDPQYFRTQRGKSKYYREALQQTLPDLAAEAKKAERLAKAMASVKSTPTKDLPLNTEDDFLRARLAFYEAMDALSRAPFWGSSKVREALRLKYAPALDTLDAVDQLRRDDYSVAFWRARRAIDQHGEKHPGVRDFLGDELEKYREWDVGAPKTATKLHNALLRAGEAATAFDDDSVFSHAKLDRFRVGARKARDHLKADEKKLLGLRTETIAALAKSDFEAAKSRLEEAQGLGFEPFADNDEPELGVTYLLSEITCVLQERERAKGAERLLADAQATLKTVGRERERVTGEFSEIKGFADEITDKLKGVQEKIGQLKKVREEIFEPNLAIADYELLWGDPDEVEKYLQRAKETLEQPEAHQNYRLREKLESLNAEWERLSNLPSGEKNSLKRFRENLRRSPPQRLADSEVLTLEEWARTKPDLRVYSFLLVENSRLTSSFVPGLGSLDLQEITDKTAEFRASLKDTFKLQAGIESWEDSLRSRSSSALIVLLAKPHLEIWRRLLGEAEKMEAVVTGKGLSTGGLVQLDALWECMKLHDGVFAAWYSDWRKEFERVFNECFKINGHVVNDKWPWKERGRLRVAKPKERDQNKATNVAPHLIEFYLSSSEAKSSHGQSWLHNGSDTISSGGSYGG